MKVKRRKDTWLPIKLNAPTRIEMDITIRATVEARTVEVYNSSKEVKTLEEIHLALLAIEEYLYKILRDDT